MTAIAAYSVTAIGLLYGGALLWHQGCSSIFGSSSIDSPIPAGSAVCFASGLGILAFVPLAFVGMVLLVRALHDYLAWREDSAKIASAVINRARNAR